MSSSASAWSDAPGLTGMALLGFSEETMKEPLHPNHSGSFANAMEWSVSWCELMTPTPGWEF